MASTVRIYPGNTREQIGAKRWTVLWYELTEKAQAKLDADPYYEWDPISDITTKRVFHQSRDAAFADARRRVDSGDLFFGTADVQREMVDWLSEGDRVAEWVDVGDPETID